MQSIERILTVKETAAVGFYIACFRNKLVSSKVTKVKYTEEVLVGNLFPKEFTCI